MAKAIKKLIVSNVTNSRIGLTIYQKNGDYKHEIVNTIENVNLTIGASEELRFRKFRNIVIDFTFEHVRFIQFAPIERARQQKNYYLICTKNNNEIEAIQTDLISEILFTLNSFNDDKTRMYKRIEIVNKM